MFRPESQLAGRKTVAGRNLSDCGREPGLVIRPGTAPAKKLRAHAEAERGRMARSEESAKEEGREMVK